MRDKEELVRRARRIVKGIFQGTKQAIPYCKGDMEWRFNHMCGYGLYCAPVRKALQGCMGDGQQVRYQEYHVQMIGEQVCQIAVQGERVS